MKSVKHNGRGECIKETSPQVKSAIFRSSAVAMFDSDNSCSLRSPRREVIGENEKTGMIKAQQRNISSRSVEERFSSNRVQFSSSQGYSHLQQDKFLCRIDYRRYR